MDKHVTLLGVLFIAYHVLGLVVGFVIMGVLSSVGCLTGDPTAMTILTAVGVGLGTFLIVLSVRPAARRHHPRLRCEQDAVRDRRVGVATIPAAAAITWRRTPWP
jgi:zinc transporter ZupT